MSHSQAHQGLQPPTVMQTHQLMRAFFFLFAVLFRLFCCFSDAALLSLLTRVSDTAIYRSELAIIKCQENKRILGDHSPVLINQEEI